MIVLESAELHIDAAHFIASIFGAARTDNITDRHPRAKVLIVASAFFNALQSKPFARLLRRLWGHRGVRVGEASHPGPSSTSMAATAAACAVEIAIPESARKRAHNHSLLQNLPGQFI